MDTENKSEEFAEKPLYLTNQFLIAMPSLNDSSFSGSVTYLCQHSEEGAFGVVINRHSSITVGEVMNQMNIDNVSDNVKSLPVFDGGPVEPERGFILHPPSGKWDSTLYMTDSMALTTSRDILEAIAKDEGPSEFLIALGYAGWGAQQLEQEIINNAWLNVSADSSIIFDTPVEQRSKAAAAILGVNIDVLSSQVGHA
ncbi:MAG: YqgE/AlgH family protein [Gammaproteobacteria bacterium]|nr:YqgE/AlgH family protein [Gammaproteobacteria bacterium]